LALQPVQKKTLRERGNQRGDDRSASHGHDHAGSSLDQAVRQIGRGQVEGPMGQVDDLQHTEDHREARR